MVTSDVLVTPSTSTANRKRRLSSTQSESQWNDPNFRSSCKKRFLERSRNNGIDDESASASVSTSTSMQFPRTATATTTGSIDLLRHIIQEEFLQQQQQQQQQQQSQSTRYAVHNSNDTDMHCVTEYAERHPQQPQEFPHANHYIDDDELYDLLLEMEHEFHANAAASHSQYGSQIIPTGTYAALASTEAPTKTTTMTDWEEEMYFMSGQHQQHNDDGIQEQIMDYYSHE